jgi:hypothetical protein
MAYNRRKRKVKKNVVEGMSYSFKLKNTVVTIMIKMAMLLAGFIKKYWLQR